MSENLIYELQRQICYIRKLSRDPKTSVIGTRGEMTKRYYEYCKVLRKIFVEQYGYKFVINLWPKYGRRARPVTDRTRARLINPRNSEKDAFKHQFFKLDKH